MDPVTHTLVGAGMANAFFRRRVGPEAIPILALASNLPDIDAVVHLTGDPAALLWRRSFGHSLFTIPVWSLLLATLLRRVYPRLRLSALFGLSLLGASVHVLFDLINSFGVKVLWPFLDWQPELAIVFIIDLVLTGLLALPILLCIPRRARPTLPGLSRASILCVGAYLLFCGANRALALNFLTSVAAPGSPTDFTYVFPEPLGPQRWRGVLRHGDTYRVYLIHSLSGRVEEKEEVRTQIGDPDVERVRRTALGRRLERFFKAPVWSARIDPATGQEPGSPAVEVSVYDLRFLSLVLGLPPAFEFRFLAHGDGRVEPEPAGRPGSRRRASVGLRHGDGLGRGWTRFTL